jgi:Na+-transporting methylmalonyl-CoA/oxaloacetate decarboxylase gamma subunit
MCPGCPMLPMMVGMWLVFAVGVLIVLRLVLLVAWGITHLAKRWTHLEAREPTRCPTAAVRPWRHQPRGVRADPRRPAPRPGCLTVG